MRTVVLLAAFFFVRSISPSSPCRDTIPFSIKLARSPLVVTGDLVDVATLSFVNNHTKPFNMTLVIRCIFKGQSPADERIIIEHTPPENPRCYRTLVLGDFYVFFLNETRTVNFYKQMPFHELSFNDETTIEILKRTCRLQPRPFAENSAEETKSQCPIVSVGCE